ncbi:AAA family ATPase [Streptomyces sp. NPDC059568]|uniref:AAA family ATPase n=1 Tax=Streptomyces sp. NPDC059568 TaxID=3346868 RepID=UPI0036AA9EA6
MTTFAFAPATREQARARIGIQGPAGSGKTKTLLRIAEGLAQGGPIGLVDTERGSALTYATVPNRPELGGHSFLHLPMDTHDPRHLTGVVAEAERIGLAVLGIDSWSHFWNGRGGLLEIVEKAGSASGSGGTFGGWRTGNPIEQAMLDALLNFRGHLIVTMRTKTDYVIQGKTVTKVGTKTVQRDGTEYELGVLMDMVEGTATITKTRYEPLDGLVIHHPGEEIGETILEQLGQGVDPVAAIIDGLTAEDLTYQGALELHAKAKSKGLLSTGHLHPTTGEPTTIGDLIAEYGTALKPAPAPAPVASTPAGQPPANEQSGMAEPTADGPARPTGDAPVTAPQMRMMHAFFTRVGLGAKEDRERRLHASSLIVGRQLGSANELTSAEAATLLDTLTNFSERADPAGDFNAMIQGLLDAHTAEYAAA